MAEQPFLSKRQKGIVKGYYANRETALTQRLAELVSDIALAAGDEKKLVRLWSGAAEILAASTFDPARGERIVQSRDLETLAKVAPTIRAREKPRTER